MPKTKIEWATETWNPVTGCTKISDGCKNCYAETMHKRLNAMGQAKYKQPFNEVVCHEEELQRRFPGKDKHIFVCSMSDLLHKEVPDEFINKVLAKIMITPQHQFLILTKRSERLRDFGKDSINSILKHNGEWPCWVGVTVEERDRKYRIQKLKDSFPALVKFISFEPLLSGMGKLNLSGIDWVIVGGESGPHARTLDPDWIRNIRDQCIQQNTPFFFKQWGEYEYREVPHLYKLIISSNKVGKKKAGRMLDGRTWDEYPVKNISTTYFKEFNNIEAV